MCVHGLSGDTRVEVRGQLCGSWFSHLNAGSGNQIQVASLEGPCLGPRLASILFGNWVWNINES